MLVTSNNGGYAEVRNEPDGVLATETTQVVSVTTGGELDVDHIMNVLMGMFHFPIDLQGIAASCFENYLIFKT